MKIRVVVDGEEVRGDGLILGPWLPRTAGASGTEVMLWLSLTMGYDADPPPGHFALDDQPPDPASAVKRVVLTQTVTPARIRCLPLAASADGHAQDSSVSWAVERRVLLVARWLPLAFLAALACATVAFALFAWVFSQALMVWFEGTGDEASSLLGYVPAILPIGAPLVGLLGLGSAQARHVAFANWRTTLALLLAAIAAIAIAGRYFTVVVENRTPQTIVTVMDRKVELKPGENIALFALPWTPITAADGAIEPCKTERDASRRESLSLSLKRILSGEPVGLCCQSWALSQRFPDLWAKQPRCEPDAGATAELTHPQLTALTASPPPDAKPSDSDPKPSIARYFVRPFTSKDLREHLPQIARIPRLGAYWPTHAAVPYTQLDVEGAGFLHAVSIELPIEPSPSETVLLSWVRDYARPSQLSASLRAGPVDIGRLMCALTGDMAKPVRLQFLPAGPHLRRVLLKRAPDQSFASAFDAERPEMVTAVPLCVPDGDLSLELYFDQGFQPEGWTLWLDGSGADGSCSALGLEPSECSLASRVKRIQVHLSDGRAWGVLHGSEPCNVLASVRTEFVDGTITTAGPERAQASAGSAAKPREESKRWSWKRWSASGLDEHSAEFWVCGRKPPGEGDTVLLGLSDRTARRAIFSKDAIDVRALPLRVCYFDARLRELDANQRQGLTCGVSETLRDYLPPGCSEKSQLCE